ncbi:MAG: hypothetical protein M5T61_16905 [Acidimicrobiia bacterium]|nr:hypothetical protein [Acidimicrobiia bacterium]
MDGLVVIEPKEINTRTRQGVLRQLDQEWNEWQKARPRPSSSPRIQEPSEPLFDGIHSLRMLVEESTSEAATDAVRRNHLVLLRHAVDDDLAARTRAPGDDAQRSRT